MKFEFLNPVKFALHLMSTDFLFQCSKKSTQMNISHVNKSFEELYHKCFRNIHHNIDNIQLICEITEFQNVSQKNLSTELSSNMISTNKQKIEKSLLSKSIS